MPSYDEIDPVTWFAEELPLFVEGKGMEPMLHKILLKQARKMVIKEHLKGKIHWIPAVCAIHVLTEAMGGLANNPPAIDERFDVSVEGTTITIR